MRVPHKRKVLHGSPHITCTYSCLKKELVVIHRSPVPCRKPSFSVNDAPSPYITISINISCCDVLKGATLVADTMVEVSSTD